ncbi:MAG: PH domain-containing protein [Candidatus Levyibacteriota bacterium]
MADEKQITLTYLNIRQSIAILLTKLILIDIILSVIVVGFYFAIASGTQILGLYLTNPFLFLTVLGIVGIFKIVISCYVVLQWLNEYYEITPEYIVHKHGIIFKKQEHFRLDHVRSMNIQDMAIGELFNFATITLFDLRLNKYLDMYLVHNARRYAKVLKQLRPNIEMKEDHVWNPLREEEEISPSEKKD